MEQMRLWFPLANPTTLLLWRKTHKTHTEEEDWEEEEGEKRGKGRRGREGGGVGGEGQENAREEGKTLSTDWKSTSHLGRKII